MNAAASPAAFALFAAAPFESAADVELLFRRLSEATLPRELWTHRAHLAVGAWMIGGREGLRPEADLPGIIRRYNEVTGTPSSDSSGYHETMTMAYLRAIRAFLGALRPELPLHAKCNLLLASDLGDKTWPLRFWSAGLLFSPSARRAWAEPDLAAFPFPGA